MSELGQFVISIPPVTRSITLTALVMGGLNALGLISYSAFVPHWPTIYETFEIHRLLTGFLISHPQPMQGLMEIYMLYSFSKGLEELKFKKCLPDYVFYHLIIVPIILISSYLFLPPLLSLSPALLSALTYTWSIDNYNQQVNFYFMPIKASLLPAVSLGFRLLVDGRENFILALIGMSAAYIYNCLETGSSGPVVAFITGKQPDHVKSWNNRVGTVSSNSGIWFYASGYLPSPQGLKSLMSKLTGVDYNSKAFKMGSINSNAKHSAPEQSGAKSSGKSTGLGGMMGGGNAFRGKGQRLGSTTVSE
ncbi:hypothetical protein CANARDRAFT_9715 [[Candida] arabinofermentans NRRL YB-2248]|uniref:Derlin n=1 Tax=[Candida] arabinofermentans NRRL YB-2248 TaxID=983967 RepID=A0A1E4SUY2_9ASCO|nr:hypothetical protein CANARDRAFT_9715 [[Candida] arabinofermentans NRRL YB-2248]